MELHSFGCRILEEKHIQAAFALLEAERGKGNFPGFSALVGQGDQTLASSSGGFTHPVSRADNQPVTSSTIFDCASLTKVVVTLPLLLILVDHGRLSLNDPVSRYLPAFAGEGKEQVTLQHLLTHTSGLPSSLDLYSHGWSREQIEEHVCRASLTAKPGERVIYSDLGFILLGEIASALLRQPLEQAARRLVLEPLGMADSGFCPGALLKPRIAATEFDPALGRHKHGEVHDENAAAMGGVSGHAGLFATAADLAAYAAMWLGRGTYRGRRLFSRAAAEAALRRWTAQEGAARGLGWVLRGDTQDAAGDWFSVRAFGHTGFTGTSLWLDPAGERFAILLTNRVYGGRGYSITRLRACFHNAVAAAFR
jgi:serine-type D-Ala-D-Ala carboxypeptidase